MKVSLEELVSFLKQRGFIFQSFEIYGGLGSFYDFGPLGVFLKNNLKQFWWKKIVLEREDVYGIDSVILTPEIVFSASGHLENFYDKLVECKKCHQRFREDKLWEGEYGEIESQNGQALCPLCKGELTRPRNFNLMFKTHLGPVEEEGSIVYLRPETAQGIFVNFSNILQTMRAKLPFGIAQIGKSFRNEITPKNFIFRIREFEQMELEYFVKPEEAERWFNYWVEERWQWYLSVGLSQSNLRRKIVPKEELAHYAEKVIDIEYHYPFGWGELEGIANRTDFDLKTHSSYSGKELVYFDEETKEKIQPYVIEPSIGVERLFLAIISEAFEKEIIKNSENNKKEERKILKLKPFLAPIKGAILPLLSNREELIKTARQIFDQLKKDYLIAYDDSGSIGRRYRRQDEIGTPYCFTVDFQTLEDGTLTVRERDSMEQRRIHIEEIDDFLKEKTAFP